MKLLDYSGLQRFLAKIKTLLDSKANAQHTHSTSDVTDLLSDQHTWSSQQSYNADLNLNYSSTDVDDIIDTLAGSYTAEDFLAQNNVWTGDNTFTADVSLAGGIYAQNYYLGTTAFGDIVTHNASEFSASSHTHGSITNDGKVGTTANKPLITGTGGVVQAGSFGNQANTFCEGNDSRLSDARTPVAHTHTKSQITDFPTNYVTTDTTQTIAGTKTFDSQIKGTIDKSKDYYLSDNTLASTNGSLGTVKYYPATNTADLDTEIFEHSLWAAQKVFNSIPTALDSFYYIDQYFYLGRSSIANRIQILRGYRNANLHMVRVYNQQTNSWSEWAKFADDSDVVHKSGDETVGGNKDFSGTTNIQSLTINGVAAGDIVTHNASEFSVSGHTHTASEVSGLATVATSGSYNDLSNKPTIDSALSSTSTNAVQNKVINTALAGKAASSHTHTKSQITDFPTKTSQFTNDSHQTITVGTDTTSTATPAHSGTFTCIDSVTRDSNGHVTAVNTKTVTLPADNNTDTKVTNTLGTTTKAYVTGTTSATTNTGTQIFDTGVYLSTTAGELVATKFTGTLNGNASSATQFSANKAVTLTGDVTGTASSKAGWSVATTLSDSGVTAGTYGPSADVTGNNNATISVPEITVDSKGRVTSVANRTLTCKNNTYNVYNKTLTIQKNGTNVATFTSNSNTDVTANITVPTKVSELDNDSGFLTSHQSLANYVTLDGVQTISNTKVFTKKQSIKNTAITNYKAAPSADTVISVEFLSNDNKFWGALSHTYYTTGHSIMALETSNWSTSGTQGHWRIQFGTDKALSPVYFRPEASNTVDLGDSSHQWKSVYAQSYYYNGTAWGLDKKNVWTTYNVVNGYRFTIRQTSQEIGVLPTSNQWNGFNFVDKNEANTVSFQHAFLSSGETRFTLSMVDNVASHDSNSTSWIEFLRLTAYPEGMGFIIGADARPMATNAYELGTSTKKWKTLNGINPGALSFPNLEYSDSNKWIDIKPAITNTAGADNWYYPAVDGWVFIIASGGAAPDLNVLVFIASGLNFISGAVPAAESSTGARWCQCLAPAGSRVRIRFNKGSTSCTIEKAFFIPCQGNA